MYPFNWLTPKTREVIQKIVQTSDWRRPPSHTHTQTLTPRALRLKTTSCTLSNTKYGWGHGVAALPYGQYYLQGIIVATAVHASGRQGRQIQDTTGVRRYAFFSFSFFLRQHVYFCSHSRYLNKSAKRRSWCCVWKTNDYCGDYHTMLSGGIIFGIIAML